MGIPTVLWPAKFTFEQFWKFTQPLEGGFAANCMFMVQDLQVATGMGVTFSGKAHRADGLRRALALPWLNKNTNAPASPTEITRDYDLVLSMEAEGLAKPFNHIEKVWKPVTLCRLDEAGFRKAVYDVIVSNLNGVRRNRASFGNFDDYPADAQLCVASLTWAIGPNFHTKYPSFCAACRAQDWILAGFQSTYKNPTGTVVDRQRQQTFMMANADAAKRGFLNPDILYFPGLMALPIAPSFEIPGVPGSISPFS